MICRFRDEHIEQVLKLAKICNLSVWSFDDYLDEINRTESIGFINIKTDAILGDTINGFIISRLINHFIDPTSDNDNKDSKNPVFSNECELLNIGVAPKMQGKGIGQGLLDATLIECSRQNVESVWLDVRISNENAYRFYRKNGFEVIYTRKGYYQNPVEDALVMKSCLRKPS